MHEDLDVSESPKNKDSAVITETMKIIPIEIEDQENQNENVESQEPQDCTNPEPTSKRRKSTRFTKKKTSPKAKEITSAVVDVPKTTSPEPMEEDQTIAPVPPRYIVDGKVMVSMILPKDNKGKRRKVPGIPQTIESKFL